MSDVILEAQLDFSKAEQQAKKAVRKINNMAKGVKVGDFTDIRARNKFLKGIQRVQKIREDSERKTQSIIRRIRREESKAREDRLREIEKSESNTAKIIRKIRQQEHRESLRRLKQQEAAEKASAREIDKIRAASARRRSRLLKEQQSRISSDRSRLGIFSGIRNDKFAISELREMANKADSIEKRAIQKSIARQKRKTRAIIEEIQKQELAAGRLSFSGQIVPGGGGFGGRRTPPSLARSAAARRSGGGPSKFGSRATGIAFQLQQTVEDFSFAGFRGASNNLALIASQMQHTTKQGTMLNKVLGVGGFVAIAGLAIGAMIPLVKGFFDWASGAKAARERQKKLNEEALKSAEAITKANIAIADQLDILDRPLILPTDQAVKQIENLQKALQRVINTGGKGNLLSSIESNFSGSERFAALTEIFEGQGTGAFFDLPKGVKIRSSIPRSEVRENALDAFGVQGGAGDFLSALGVDPKSAGGPRVPKALKDIIGLSDVGKAIDSLKKKIRNLTFKEDALFDSGADAKDISKVHAEIQAARLQLGELLVQVFNDPKIRKAITAQILGRALKDKDVFAQLQKAIGIDKLKKVQEAAKVQEAISKSPSSSDIISNLQGKGDKTKALQDQLRSLRKQFDENLKTVGTLKQLNGLQEKFKNDAGIILEKIKLQELQEKAAAEAKREHIRLLKEQVSQHEKIVRSKQREIEKQQQIIKSAKASKASNADSFADGAFNAAGDFGKASINVAAARRKAAIRRRFPGLKFLGPNQMVLKGIDAQIDRQAQFQQEGFRRNLLEKQGGFLSSQAAAAGKGGDKDRQINLLKKLQGLQLQESSRAAGQGNLGRSRAAFQAASKTQAQIQNLLQNQINAAQQAIQAAQQQKNAAQKNANAASGQLKAAQKQDSAATRFANAVNKFNAKVGGGNAGAGAGAAGAGKKGFPGGLGAGLGAGGLGLMHNQMGVGLPPMPAGLAVPNGLPAIQPGFGLAPNAFNFGANGAVMPGPLAGGGFNQNNVNNININGNANQADILGAVAANARMAAMRAGSAVSGIFGF